MNAEGMAEGAAGAMEAGMAQLQQRLRSAEAKAEEVLLLKQELVDLDRQRNAGREAITALKKHARGAAARRAGGAGEGGTVGGGSEEAQRPLVTPLPSVAKGASGLAGSAECAVCGAVGQKERVWVAMGGGEMFVRMPLHHAHVHVKRAGDLIDGQMAAARERQKAVVRRLAEEGGLAGRVGESMVRALTTLKDAAK
ncbi:hypothetical protein CLOM_g1261 [Closterium sp. NIES-68]|nr:hypothetical protein CLOM_g1261 [Closterium sp. NIES-68]GJP80811.1 hypothetical protein CLOP_g11010 [Closterium sp. NIES-67]